LTTANEEGTYTLSFAFLDFAVVPAEWVKRVMTAVVAIDRGRSYRYPMQRPSWRLRFKLPRWTVGASLPLRKQCRGLYIH
jgi:hypothetical protein